MNARWGRLATGIGLIAVGAVWAFQGYGTITGSFMTGSPVWLWIGIACITAGVVVLLLAVLTARRTHR